MEFERDVGKFRKTAAYVPEELTLGALNGDLDTGDERSREIDDSYVRVATLKVPVLSQNRHIKGCAATQTVARAQRLCI